MSIIAFLPSHSFSQSLSGIGAIVLALAGGKSMMKPRAQS